MRRIFAEAGVPPSLALLPVIESEFHRTARGRRDDLGLWQFRSTTARRFGLVVNEHRDQRLHPYHASRAAARYLRYLHRHYRGDWPLAIAAYNAGEHRVDRALARLPNGTFWQLVDHGYLPRTTKDYVPRFLAVVRVVEGKQVCRRSEVPTTLVNLDAPVVDPRRGAITQEARR
jgi:membrane-bound lytic murein transglycosylase D